jgi:hypothetical protein
MGWFFKKQEEFRLLDTRTPGGGVIFWVRDAKCWDDAGFIHDMLLAKRSSLPKSFIAAMESPGSNETLQVRFVPRSDGSCHIHLEYAARDTKPPEVLAAAAERKEGPALPFAAPLRNTDR